MALLGSAGALGAVGCSASPVLQSTAARPSGSATVGTDVGANAITATGAEESLVADGPAPESRFTPNGDRTLVVIELQGGNDGLATLQPIDDGRIRSMRPDLGAPAGELIDVGGGYGWHPNLAGMHALGLAGVVGIGSDEPDFSHFEMEQRWWRGDSGRRSRLGTGFFGRLCDQLDVGAPVTGLSLSGGPTPALLADKAVTVGLTDPGANWIFQEENPWISTFRTAVAAMAAPSASDGAAMGRARHGLDDMTSFSESIARMEPSDDQRYPWSELGQQLRFANDVIALDAGVRVLHVRLGGFDTHVGQEWRHADLLREVDESVTAFSQHLQEQGRWESTLVVTTSEFGRRVEQNDGGTDHGGASTMLVCGAGLGGLHGDMPDLGALDDGNVVATARFEDYYATIAEEWFGVPVEEVLPSGGTSIAGLLRF
ncbi:MAG: DUF1501 domain-containing protein [Actinomycetota bacterium]